MSAFTRTIARTSDFSGTIGSHIAIVQAMRTGKPPHLKHFDYRGFHRYSLTFCTHERRTRFTDPRAFRLALSQISRAASEEAFAVITYCFMPDHAHLLVHGQSENADGKRFISLAKQYSSYYYSKEIGGKLWQRYGHERTLRRMKTLSQSRDTSSKILCALGSS